MTNSKIKIAIIGAGPCGVAAAIPFLKHKDKFEITMISSGDSLYTADINKIKSYLKNQNRDMQHQFWELNNTKSKTLIPKKLFFGTSSVYDDIQNDLEKSSNIDFEVSHSIGGLSNVWGATVTGVPENDLKRYNYNDEINKYFETITNIFPISGIRDSVDSDKSFNINYQNNSLNFCSQAKRIVEEFNRNKNYYKKNSFRLGYAKLAVNTTNGNICNNSGLEMYGCYNDSIFNSLSYINKIESDIDIIKNTLVDEIVPNDNSITFICRNKENNDFKLEFDKVIVAAGTINTSKLVLKLLEKHNLSSLIIKDSQKYFFLYFTFFKSKKNEEKNIVGLSQVFAQTEIDNHSFQIQLYHSKVFIRDLMNNIFSYKLTRFLLNIFGFFIDRLMIGVVYFPEEISHQMKMSYNKKDKTFFIQEKKNKNFSFRFILKIFMRLNKFVFTIKSITLPFFYKCKVGVSQHFGSSVPPSIKKELGKTSLKGKLYPYNNIYISDTSSLNRIASSPPTFISMSNAYRISSNIIKENI